MADLSRTIEIIFNGQDNVSDEITGIAGGIGTLEDKMQSVAAPFAAAGDAVVKLDAALAALAVGGMALALSKSIEFEAATLELQKVLGEGEDVNLAIAKATELSETYGESATSILASFANFRQAGYDLEESMTLTKNALDLVIAGELEMATSSELVVSALKGFGEEADQASRFVDILNEVSNNFATSAGELGEGMARIAPIADLMGFSMEEMAGVLTPIIEVFRSGSEAANALKTGLLRLVSDNPKVIAALDDLGVSQRDVNGDMRDGKDIYYDVAKALESKTDAEKISYTAQITGIHQTAKLAVVFGDLEQQLRITEVAMGAAGSATEEVKIRLASAEVAVNIFKAAFDNMARVIGDQFRLSAVDVINGATDIEIAIRNMVSDGTFDEIFDYINEFSADLGALLSDIAKNLPEAFEGVDWGPLLDSLDRIQEAVGELFEDVDLSTPEGLRAVIDKVVEGLGTLGNVTAGIIEGWKPFIEGIKGVIQSFMDMDEAEQVSSGKLMALGQAVEKIGGLISVAILLIGENADKLEFIFSTVVKTISGALDLAVVAWNGVKVGFYEVIIDILEAAKKLSGLPGFGFLEADVQANIDKLTEFKNVAESTMLDAADSAAKNLTGIQTDFRNTAKTADLAKKDTEGWLAELEKIPGDKQTRLDVEAHPEGATEFGDILHENVPEELYTKAGVDSDEPSIDGHKDKVDDAAPEEKTTKGKLNPDSPSIQNTKQKIDEAVPASKMMEIQLQGDIDKELAEIEAQAAMVQTAFEWKAKIDIAQIEADAKVAVAAFDSVGKAVEATASAAADMFGSLLDNYEKLGWVEQRIFRQLVEKQMDMEQQALNMQQQLIDAQVAYMQAKADALRGGDGLIKISSDGLEPALETIMWQILEKVQLRVTEEASEFLLGL